LFGRRFQIASRSGNFQSPFCSVGGSKSPLLSSFLERVSRLLDRDRRFLAFPMPTPEELARQQIDVLLQQRGWLIQDYKSSTSPPGAGSPFVKCD
jgi:hypothetical protein